MKILITGGAGFVGCNLALAFNKDGHQVVVFDNLVRRGSEVNLQAFRREHIQFVHGDIRSPEDFKQLGTFQPDVILECSAQPSATEGYKNVMFDITNNYLGLVNVIEYARQVSAKVIFWSTNKVYGGDKLNARPRIEMDTRWVWADYVSSDITEITRYGVPEEWSVDGGDHSIYGMTKICADITCQEYANGLGVPIVVNRFSCLAGERQWGIPIQGWVSWFAIAAELGLPLTFFGWQGKQVRDVLFIADVIELVRLELEQFDSIKGQVFNVGGGLKNTLSLIEAVDVVKRLTGRPLFYTITNDVRKADQCIYYSDTRKIERALGWQPQIGVEEGYSRIISWVRDNHTVLEQLYI